MLYFELLVVSPHQQRPPVHKLTFLNRQAIHFHWAKYSMRPCPEWKVQSTVSLSISADFLGRSEDPLDLLFQDHVPERFPCSRDGPLRRNHEWLDRRGIYVLGPSEKHPIVLVGMHIDVDILASIGTFFLVGWVDVVQQLEFVVDLLWRRGFKQI